MNNEKVPQIDYLRTGQVGYLPYLFSEQPNSLYQTTFINENSQANQR